MTVNSKLLDNFDNFRENQLKTRGIRRRYNLTRRKFNRFMKRPMVSTFISRFQKILKPLTSEPMILIIMILTIVCSYMHVNFPTDSYIKKLCDELIRQESTKLIGTWLQTNEHKVIALAMYLPTFLTMHGDTRGFSIVITVAWVLLVKKLNIRSYATQAILFYAYTKLNYKHDKMVVIATALILRLANILYTQP